MSRLPQPATLKAVSALKLIDASLGSRRQRKRPAREAELRSKLLALIDDDYTAVFEDLLWQKSEVQRIVLHDLRVASCLPGHRLAFDPGCGDDT
ncbi:MAG: hypothetical protein R2706_13755 [Acidimicrobiales bacterium]